MLATPSSTTSAHRRRHSHKRSAAISGDFDLEFFKQQIPSINQQLESPMHTAPSTPNASTNLFNTNEIPTLTVIEQDQKCISEQQFVASTPSPKKNHIRMNSWAYPTSSTISSKEVRVVPTTITDYNSSSSNETTPDLKRQAVAVPSSYRYSASTCSSPQYKIPEATIDLDLASCVYRDPSVPTKTGTNKNLNRHFHRRTESAPELEDFLKYKVFSKDNSRKNSAIFEEVEEEEENYQFDALSSSSSQISQTNQNPSLNSLENLSQQQQHSSYSRHLQSPSSIHHSLTSTPTSAKTNTTTRRGAAAAARYQNYYNNNFLLSNALKSSDSLTQAVSSTPITTSSLHKSSISSFNNLRSTSTTSTASTSLHSPTPQSPSRFKFESQVYDMPERSSSSSLQIQTPKPKSNLISSSTSTSSSAISKSHKKSNSLLKSFSSKIRRNSTTSSKAYKQDIQLNLDATPQKVKKSNESDTNVGYLEGDSTLTPFDFGEPGPELDLTTMTPKYHSDYNRSNEEVVYGSSNISSPSIKKSLKKTEDRETPKKSKMTFFGWRKK